MRCQDANTLQGTVGFTSGTDDRESRRALALMVGGLALLTLLCFWPAVYGEFSDYDDGDYVTYNLNVQKGLTPESIYWAFASGDASNWHPLTWLSLMLDYEFDGLNPYYFRRTNVFLHTANGVLVLLIFYGMTGALWRSALVAACFAIHPLRAESVAWIAERKDVLSVFFGLLAIAAYVKYARPGSLPRRKVWYPLMLVLYALSLMSKPTLVTLPFLLLLLDLWPLERFAGADQRSRLLGLLILEKIPLLGLAIASSLITYLVQAGSGAAAGMDILPLTARVDNALIAYVRYMGNMVWFENLAMFYPHLSSNFPVPLAWPFWQVVAATGLMMFMTAMVVWQWRIRPWLAVGWFWFVGTLVPMIGLVQVGSQAMADRYSYVPSIGLLIMLVWSIPERWFDFRRSELGMVGPICAFLVVCVLFFFTRRQVGYWQNDLTLLDHTLRVTQNNYMMYENLGAALLRRAQLNPAEINKALVDEAIKQYRKSLAIKPDSAKSHFNLGNALQALSTVQGGSDEPLREAIEHYKAAIHVDRKAHNAHTNLGTVLANREQYDEALEQFRIAVRLNPEEPLYQHNLGTLLFRLGKTAEAIKHLRIAVSRAAKESPEHDVYRQSLNTALAAEQKQIKP